jgi:monoamine oxidase
VAKKALSLSRRQFLILLGGAATAVLGQEFIPKRVAQARNGASVLIIGAGIAGLAAGQALLQAGYSVTILEGRERVGGRVWTNRSMNNVPLEMGAAWLQGVTGNPLSDIVEEYGIETVESDAENIALYTADGEVLDEETMVELDEYFSELMDEVAVYAEELDDDISLGDAIRTVLDEWDLSEEEYAIMLTLVSTNIELEYAADVDDLSAWWWNSGSGFRGGNAIFLNGFDQIVDRLAQGLDIRLNELVNRVEYSEEGAFVQTENERYEADYAIVTLPLGVLKNGSVTFEPQLPNAKRTAISNLGMSVLNKAYLRFPEVFWDRDVEWIGYLGDGSGEWAASVNIYAYFNEPVLLLFNAGEFGLAIEDLSDDEIANRAMDMLRRVYGEHIPEPEEVLVTRWGKDHFSFGSYSSIYLGASPDDRSALAEPLDNVLFFAGEATSVDYAATVHGALLSGRRAAQEIIETS